MSALRWPDPVGVGGLVCRVLLQCLVLAWPTSLLALDADYRLKWFSTASTLAPHDVERAPEPVARGLLGREGTGTPTFDHSADLRIMVRHDEGSLHFLLDYSAILLTGDRQAIRAQQDARVDQTVVDDSRRWADLTWDIEDGNRHRSIHRLDRAALQWRPGDWTVTVGRQAVSWGSGIVFQPMDLFSPFSPTVVDRDYKAGDDLLLVERLLPAGQDLALLHIVRRDESGDVSSDVASTALKWHGYAGAGEFEVAAGRHYGERVGAVSARWPLGSALVRLDLVATENAQGEWVVSGIANTDVTFVVADKTIYVFAEFFHNGWGVGDLSSLANLDVELTQRLARGEVFNLMQNYVALGTSIQWHPLLTQSLTTLTNLHDRSTLLQTQFSIQPGDNQSLDVGWVKALGRAGDEFGGVDLADVPGLGPVTTGGGGRMYLRWVYFL